MKTINIIIVLLLISYSNFAQTGPRVSPSASTSSTGSSTGDLIWQYKYENVVLTNQELNFNIEKSDDCSKIKRISLSYANNEDGGDIKFTIIDKSIYNLKRQGNIINVKVKLNEIIHDKKIICTIEWNFNGCKELVAQQKVSSYSSSKNLLMTAAVETNDENKSQNEQKSQAQISKPKSVPTLKKVVVQSQQQALPINDETKPPVTTSQTNTVEIWRLHIFQQDVAVPTSGRKND